MQSACKGIKMHCFNGYQFILLAQPFSFPTVHVSSICTSDIYLGYNIIL